MSIGVKKAGRGTAETVEQNQVAGWISRRVAAPDGCGATTSAAPGAIVVRGFLEQAIVLIEQAKSIDEIKDIRDKAEACRAYVKQQDDCLKLQNDVAEIKLRCERRGGELLNDLGLRTGPKNSNWSHDGTNSPALKDLGLTKNDSSRWQTIASMPEEDFERHIKSTKESEQELTTASVLRAAKKVEPKAPPLIPEFWEFDEVIDAIVEAASTITAKCDPKFRKSLAAKLVSLGEELAERGDL